MNSQFRQAPSGATAPQYSGGGAQHVQQEGLMTPMQLQKQFFFSHKSEVDGNLYEGQFTVRKLSIKDIARIGVRKTQLNGGYHYDEANPGSGVTAETDWIHQMIAYLEVSLVQQPTWFNLDQIYDPKLLGDIFSKAAEFENNFFRSNRDQNVGPGSGQNDSSGEGKESSAAGHASPVVGGEVPPTLDP
jgi:hypothetical protein